MFIKDTVSRDFLLQVFLGIISSKPLKITEGSFHIFLKICRDIRKSRCTPGVSYTGGKFATGVNYTGGKFATDTAGVIDTGTGMGGKLPQVSNRWKILRTI